MSGCHQGGSCNKGILSRKSKRRERYLSITYYMKYDCYLFVNENTVNEKICYLSVNVLRTRSSEFCFRFDNKM